MSLGFIGKDKLIFDPLLPAEGDNMGAFVRAGNDGTQISWTANVNVPAFLVVQDLTYTAACTDFDAGNSITIEYADTATAGSETVVVTLQAILVGIESGVSTATQIKAAIDASLAASELVNVAITGTGATAQVTAGPTSLASGTLKQALDVHYMGSPHNGIFHEDCQHTSGDKGQLIFGVRHDADTSMVSHDGDYAPLQIDENGNLKVVADLDVSFDYVYSEDDPNSSGSLGAYVLSVRRDALAINTSLDGDYSDFKTNDRGGLWTVPVGTVADDAADNEYPVKVGSRSTWGALAAISADADRANMISDKYRRVYVNNGANIGIEDTAVSITNAAASPLPATPLEGRRTLMIQNLSGKAIYIGKTGVTSVNGFRVAAGAAMVLDVGQDNIVYARGDQVASQDIRVLEMA